MISSSGGNEPPKVITILFLFIIHFVNALPNGRVSIRSRVALHPNDRVPKFCDDADAPNNRAHTHKCRASTPIRVLSKHAQGWELQAAFQQPPVEQAVP